MTEDARGPEYDQTRAELAKQRANNERLTVTLREARTQILALKAEVDRLAEPPSAYGVYLGDAADDGIDQHLHRRPQDAGGRDPRRRRRRCWSPARRSCSTRP